MKWWIYGLLASVILWTCGAELQAARRSRLRERSPSGASSPVAVGGGSAQAKAHELARRGQLVHLGGGFGGGSREGIGYGSTRDQAIQSACYWGQLAPREIGAAQGAGGWYAVVFY